GLARRCWYALFQPAQLLVQAGGPDGPACTYACSWARTAARAANADTGPSHGAAPATRVSTTPAQNQRRKRPAVISWRAARACAVGCPTVTSPATSSSWPAARTASSHLALTPPARHATA